MAKFLFLAFATLLSIAKLGVEANMRIAEGRECLHPSGVIGICSRVSKCPGKFDAIIEARSNSSVCSYKGKIAIICCIVGRPGVKSVEACNRLKALAPNLGVSPIAGGVKARYKFPHMALLGYDNADVLDEGPWKCGGSLISDQFVLTAAHCVNTRFGNVSKILLGANNWRNLNRKEKEFQIDQVIVHPDYKPSAWYDDIALIKLKGKVRPTGSIYPACLYTQSTEPKSLIISGWGQADANSQKFNDILLEGKNELTVVNSNKCNKTYNRLGSVERSVPLGINSKMFCASDDTFSTDLSSDTCQGDSGGPIQLRFNSTLDPDVVTYEVVGVTSGGPLCGGEPPGVYTRVYYYLDWIEKIIYAR